MIRHFDMYKKNPPLNRCLIIFLLAILSPLLSLAEIKKTGVPPVSNFSKNDYHAGGQNFSPLWTTPQKIFRSIGRTSKKFLKKLPRLMIRPNITDPDNFPII